MDCGELEGGEVVVGVCCPCGSNAAGCSPARRVLGKFADGVGIVGAVGDQGGAGCGGLEHTLKAPVEVILFFFGLTNAGVQLSAMGDATWLVLAGLLIGKPVGIMLFGVLGARAFTRRFGVLLRSCSPNSLYILRVFFWFTIQPSRRSMTWTRR